MSAELNLPEGRDWTTDDIKEIVENNAVVVFGKGEKGTPQCGFSNRAYQVMEACGKPFTVVDIFRHESVRAALCTYSDFQTTPQIFIGGEMIGGSDIAQELYDNGELQKMIEKAFS